MSSGQEVGAIFGDGTGPATALLRSPTVIIASIALWGMNVCLFRLFGIDYVYVLLLDLKKAEEKEKEKKKLKKKQTRGGKGVAHTEVPTTEGAANDDFSEAESMKSSGGEVEMSGLSILTTKTEDSDEGALVNVSLYPDSPSSKEVKVVEASPNSEVNEVKLIGLAIALIITLYLSSYIWIQVGRGTTIGAIFCFYIIVLVGILLPLPSTDWIRLACKTVLIRAGALLKPRCSCIHGKPKPVPFIDVFFADGMCSMSKVSFKIEEVLV